MRKSFLAALTLAAALATAPAAFADDSTLDLVLARDSCDSTSDVPPNERLAFAPGANTDPCGGVSIGTAPPAPTDYPADDGVPFTLDPTRTVHVAIKISSYLGVAVGSIGDETVSVVLTGQKSGTTKVTTIGSASQTTPAADMLRKASYTAEFDLPLTAAKGGEYKSLNLSLSVGGSVGGGFIYHNGASMVSLPVPDPVQPA